ncbi:Sulfatase [Georgfuchsia toluolica]|uniref:Sulfatase n=1 Tax=Georgfuchsia toluolica TaxID=424218 RepID=A0A916J0U8_9PROT|nr:LTA synthase family protein [Georgfuchsia toluolica]CAG4882513.1 Sulfatase [Georgfuchsia toluolica]
MTLQGPGHTLMLAFLAICALTRAALLWKTGATQVPPALWPGIFAIGLWFDLAVLAWLASPLLLWQALRRKGMVLTPLRKMLRIALCWLAISLLLFGALAEWTFWDEFSTRFNFIAVDYLIYTHEVIGNILESYPVGALLAGIGLAGAALVWTLSARILAVSVTQPRRLVLVGIAIALPLASWYLADSDQMLFSANVYANELAGNGLMTFFAALRRNDLDYDRFYRTVPDAKAHHILATLGVEREELSEALKVDDEEDETFDPRRIPFSRPPRNVVLITVESLSAEFLGSFGNKQGLTPRLDRLANEGLLFTQLYATGTRTVRGLDALTIGLPPIPGQAIARRPGNDHLATVGEVLRRQGIETLFIYGGYGYFDNMNAYFSGNDYQVIDRTDFPKSSVGFANIWGVADEYLFDNTLTQLDRVHASGKPFLAQIMTTSNHRPYTYPDGRIDIPSPGRREGGVKYTDYAIGHFIEQARAKPWFADTLFVIVADHCASAAGKTRLPVPGYHIPLIMYAPKMLKPGRYDRMVSQIDIPPTLIDVMGLRGDEHFFGTSVFEQGKHLPRAFISNYQELGYLKGDRLVVLGPRQRVEMFSIRAGGSAVPVVDDPVLEDEAVAWYQTAFREFKRGELTLP